MRWSCDGIWCFFCPFFNKNGITSEVVNTSNLFERWLKKQTTSQLIFLAWANRYEKHSQESLHWFFSFKGLFTRNIDMMQVWWIGIIVWVGWSWQSECVKINRRLILGKVIRCSTLYFELVVLSILNLHLCSWMFFNSIKEINRLRKDINRLLGKGMSNIHLKVTIEKNWHAQNFDFLSLKSSPPVQFFGSSNSRRSHWIIKLLVAT